MSEKMVLRFKVGIYLTFFAAVIIIAIQELTATPYDYHIESNDPDSESSEFWPPDMVPHPTVPGDGPKRNSEGDLA